MSIFEVLASEDNEQQERLAGTRAVIAAQTRAKEAFGTFVAKASDETERNARIALVAADLDAILSDVANEYSYENVEQLRNAATVALGGGHDSDCSCGFCANKGSFGKDDDKSDDKKDDDSDDEKGEKSDSDDSDDKKDADKKPWEKDSSVSPRVMSSIDWDGIQKTADGFSFCECNCDGCDGGNHCESEKCIETKHSGNPGNPASAGSSDKESKTAADVETGDTYATETADLPSSKDGVGGPSPKIDKSNSGDNLGWDLEPIDVPSERHPTEEQQIHDTPDYKADLPGVSDTGKRVDADATLQPEFNTGDRTDTWTGTEGQANPVTSGVLAKWSVA